MIFLLAFSVGTLWHLWIIARQRAWYFTPLLLGCICKYCCVTAWPQPVLGPGRSPTFSSASRNGT
ncbi:hypothetical protein AUP68_10769 [Ilyonectria robusta]